MCCTNVANLLLARTNARARELAVRSALGAGRPRIVRQLLTESLVLAALGGLLGIAVGAAILKAAPSLVPPGLLPLSVPLAFDQRVLMFSVATAFSSRSCTGLRRPGRRRGCRWCTSCRSTRARRRAARSRLRRALAIAEVAVAVLLLCGAGLLLRTLLTLKDVDPGNRADGAPDDGHEPRCGQGSREVAAVLSTIEREVRTVPGVGDVAWGTAMPFDGQFYGQAFEVDGDPPRPPPIATAPCIRSSARPIFACSASLCSRDAPSPTPTRPTLRKWHRG